MSVARIDPQKLTPTELQNEWSIREEELRIQNEQLRESEQQIAAIASRFERIFQYLPVPVILVDFRGFIKDINLSGLEAMPNLGAMRNYFLPRALDADSKHIMTMFLSNSSKQMVETVDLKFVGLPDACKTTFIMMSNDVEADCAVVIELAG